MLLVLVLKVPKLSIKLVQSVFLLLNLPMSFINGVSSFGNRLFLVGQKSVDAVDSLIVIWYLDVQNIYSFKECTVFVIWSNLSFSQSKKGVVLIVTDFLLFIDQSLLEFYFFSDWKVIGVVGIAVGSVLGELTSSGADLGFRIEDGFQKLDLLFFDRDVFLSYLVKFSNESVNFNSIIGNLLKTFVL